MNRKNKNSSLRHGCFTYNLDLDRHFDNLSIEEAYIKKNEFIQSTTNDFCSILRRTPYAEVICIASHLYEFNDRLRDGYERQPHIHFFWYQRDYKLGTTGLIINFIRNRKFQGNEVIYIIKLYFIYYFVTGHWTSTRVNDPYGCWEYLHQGRGRRIHQENMELLQKFVPIEHQHSSAEYVEYCSRPTYANQEGEFIDEENRRKSTNATSYPTSQAGSKKNFMVIIT